MGDGMFWDHLFPLHCRLSGRLQSCDPIAIAVKNSRVILIGPSARYISHRCCDTNEHLENYNNKEYESEILGGIETINQTLEGWAAEKGLNYNLVDPTELSEPAEFPLSE